MFSSRSRSAAVSKPEPISSKDDATSNSNSSEQLLIKIPGVVVHLIESDRSVHLASGDLSIVGLKQGETIVAVIARVGDNGIRWPLAKDAASVKLDESHYFFTLRLPLNEDDTDIETEKEVELLNYGVTIASKGQEGLLKELDNILETYSCLTVQETKEEGNWVLIEGNVAKGISPEELKMEEKKKELLEESSAAFWSVLAPNVDDYSGSIARMIAAGSGRLIKGIIWCGDVTVERLKLGNDFLSKKLMENKESDVQISPATMERIKKVNMLTRKSEEMANSALSGVLKVSGFITSSIVNSCVGRKFFSLFPGQIVLASLDGFNKVCDAVEYAGKNVLSTSTVVTTDLVTHRLGEQAGQVTNEGLDAAGHAVGIAWAVFKLRKAVNPKSSFKPTALVKAAAVANSTGIKKI